MDNKKQLDSPAVPTFRFDIVFRFTVTLFTYNLKEEIIERQYQPRVVQKWFGIVDTWCCSPMPCTLEAIKAYARSMWAARQGDAHEVFIYADVYDWTQIGFIKTGLIWKGKKRKRSELMFHAEDVRTKIDRYGIAPKK